MIIHRSRRGLDLPLSGAPIQTVGRTPSVSRVAFLADDFPGLRPKVLVAPDQVVALGAPMVEDRGRPGVVHVAPGAGRVSAVNRGSRRALQSIVILLDDSSVDTAADLDGRRVPDPARAPVEELRRVLVNSGLWTAFRARPFGHVPSPSTQPAGIVISAMDSNPHAPTPEVVLSGAEDAFAVGLGVVSRLSTGPAYLCVRRGSRLVDCAPEPVAIAQFEGPHPAGTPGYHVHRLLPACRRRTVWTIGYQDVIAIGRLFVDGRLDMSRIVAVAGPAVQNPQLVRTRVGAHIPDLVDGASEHHDVRWISGSVLTGKAAMSDVFAYLGRYDVQVTGVPEGNHREFLGWLRPGWGTFSVFPVFASRLRRAPLPFTTNRCGGRRAMMPIGTYEAVLPFDLVPSHLLRALAAQDVEQAERLGCLELLEEDLALCTFVDPGKVEYGPLLRRVLDHIEREG